MASRKDIDGELFKVDGKAIDPARITAATDLATPGAESPIVYRVHLPRFSAFVIEPRALLREQTTEDLEEISARRIINEARFGGALLSSGHMFINANADKPEPIVARFPVYDSDFIRYSEDLRDDLLRSFGIPAELLEASRPSSYPLYIENGRPIGVVQNLKPSLLGTMLEAEVALASGIGRVDGTGFALHIGANPRRGRWSHAMATPRPRVHAIGLRRRYRGCGKKHRFGLESRVCERCGITAERFYFGDVKRWKRRK